MIIHFAPRCSLAWFCSWRRRSLPVSSPLSRMTKNTARKATKNPSTISRIFNRFRCCMTDGSNHSIRLPARNSSNFGKDHLEDRSAISWMAENASTPEARANTPVFAIENADVRHLRARRAQKAALQLHRNFRRIGKDLPCLLKSFEKPEKEHEPRAKILARNP